MLFYNEYMLYHMVAYGEYDSMGYFDPVTLSDLKQNFAKLWSRIARKPSTVTCDQ